MWLDNAATTQKPQSVIDALSTYYARDNSNIHRGAHTLASTVASMCQAAPGKFALGIGTSSNVIVERWNGMEFDKPYQRVRDTIRFLRASLAGEKVTETYETFAVNGFRAGLSYRAWLTVDILKSGIRRAGMAVRRK